MRNFSPAQAKKRPKAYEIPTWAIADAIRRRADKVKAVVGNDPEPPQRADGMAEFVGPEAIALEGLRPACGPRAGTASPLSPWSARQRMR